jgi:2-polyprenyl-3-methyl-5-hydroxy-6-metoxy-1,4-benzoquinol methylase
MATQWLKYYRETFNVDETCKPQVLEYGCGFGPYGAAFRELGCKYEGIELSEYAVKNNPFNLNIRQGNIKDAEQSLADIVLCIDVLEHLTDEELFSALKNIKQEGSLYIFSIPFIGDPNLDNDNTHKQFRTKEEWIKLLSDYGFKIEEAPKNWYFAHQLLIGR